MLCVFEFLFIQFSIFFFLFSFCSYRTRCESVERPANPSHNSIFCRVRLSLSSFRCIFCVFFIVPKHPKFFMKRKKKNTKRSVSYVRVRRAAVNYHRRDEYLVDNNNFQRVPAINSIRGSGGGQFFYFFLVFFFPPQNRRRTIAANQNSTRRNVYFYACFFIFISYQVKIKIS